MERRSRPAMAFEDRLAIFVGGLLIATVWVHWVGVTWWLVATAPLAALAAVVWGAFLGYTSRGTR